MIPPPAYPQDLSPVLSPRSYRPPAHRGFPAGRPTTSSRRRTFTLAAARWLTGQQGCLISANNWAVEVVPSENRERPFEVHHWNLTGNGVHHLENLDPNELERDPGSPIAIR